VREGRRTKEEAAHRHGVVPLRNMVFIHRYTHSTGYPTHTNMIQRIRRSLMTQRSLVAYAHNACGNAPSGQNLTSGTLATKYSSRKRSNLSIYPATRARGAGRRRHHLNTFIFYRAGDCHTNKTASAHHQAPHDDQPGDLNNWRQAVKL